MSPSPYQSSFFEVSQCYERLDKHGDPLALLTEHIEWSGLKDVMGMMSFAVDHNGGKGGRKPLCRLMMAKLMILQALHNLSDEAMEYQINDRLSFKRFLGLDVAQKAPDAKTIWKWREHLKEEKLHKALFAWFEGQLCARGYEAKKGQIVDATFVPTHKPTPQQQKEKKEGTPLTKRQSEQRDKDADFTKKGNVTHHGYKNHIQVDPAHKIIRDFQVTPASTHDSQCAPNILRDVPPQAPEEDKGVWADNAYRSEKMEEMLLKKGLISNIHERAYRNTPLTQAQKDANTQRSKIRARVEHVFGHMKNSMGGLMVHTMGLLRAEVKMAFKNLAYNIQRFAMLEVQRLRKDATTG